MRITALIIGFAIYAAACVLITRAASGATPPNMDQRKTECWSNWNDRMICRDKRSGKIVAECRKNHLTGRWECEHK